MDSFIELVIHNDDKPFLSGTKLSGVVNVYAKDTIPSVKQISLTLNGEEQVVLQLPDKKSGGMLKPVTKIHPILNERFVLLDFTEQNNCVVEGC